MTKAEKVYEEIKNLPELLQAEVLEFLQRLVSRMTRESASENKVDAASLSLSPAMRGMEDEETPSYSTQDLMEDFQ